MRQAHDVGDLTCSGQRNRVTGARVRARDHGADHVLTAHPVVAATGRGSRTPTLLVHAGSHRPAQHHINARLTDASQPRRPPPGALTARIVIISPAPGRPTGMAFFGDKNTTWIVTAIGRAGAASSDRAEPALQDGVTVVRHGDAAKGGGCWVGCAGGWDGPACWSEPAARGAHRATPGVLR